MTTTLGPTTPAGLLCPQCGGTMRLISISMHAASMRCRACGHQCTKHATVDLLRHADAVRAEAIARAAA